MGDSARIPVALTGVPETLLWTLYHRAREAARPNSVLPDPLAVELVRRIDYPFEERLRQGWRLEQWQALRARAFDDVITGFLAAHPGGTVVALGEGLETQFWRVDDGRVRWLSVDLPETALVRQVLPGHERHRQIDASALDETWMDEVDPGRGLLITAQGLLMYLPRAQVHELIRRCARRFPEAQLLFDGVPRWAGAVTQRQRARGQTTPRRTAGGRTAPVRPALLWSMDHREATALRALPGVHSVRRLYPPRGRGLLQGRLLPLAERVPLLRSQLLSIWLARFS
jgi:O-methyltransferase involved in polyketide biosynthesis